MGRAGPRHPSAPRADTPSLAAAAAGSRRPRRRRRARRRLPGGSGRAGPRPRAERPSRHRGSAAWGAARFRFRAAAAAARPTGLFGEGTLRRCPVRLGQGRRRVATESGAAPGMAPAAPLRLSRRRRDLRGLCGTARGEGLRGVGRPALPPANRGQPDQGLRGAGPGGSPGYQGK